MADNTEKSGVHITGADSGWPVGDAAAEPPHTKAGDGTDPFPKAASVAGGAVKDAGKDEVQKVTVTATGGTYTLTFDTKTTAAIAFDATAAQVRTALEGLTNIDPGDVAVTGNAGGPYTITFGGQYVDEDVAELTADDEGLEGEGAGVAIETTQAGEPL